MSESETLNLNKLYSTSTSKIYKFGFGGSPFSIPAELKQQLIKYVDKTKYLPTQGLPELRTSIANFYNNRFNSSLYSENEVVIGPGTKELLFLLQFCFDGKFIICTPSWVSYINQNKVLNKEFYKLDNSITNNYKIDLTELENILQKDSDITKCLILNSPNNPTGAVYSKDELQQLAELLRKYDTYVISDEIYWMIHFDTQCESIVTYYPEKTILSCGISKWCGGGGLRLGYFLFPKSMNDLKNKIIQVGSETYSCAPAPIQYAAIDLYSNHNTYLPYISKCTKIFNIISNWYYTQFNNNNIHCYKADGGFYLYLDFEYYRELLNNRSIYTSVDLCNTLLKDKGVSLLAGKYFGIDESKLTARFAYVDFDGDFVFKNVDNLTDNNIEEYFPNIVIGVQLLIGWILII